MLNRNPPSWNPSKAKASIGGAQQNNASAAAAAAAAAAVCVLQVRYHPDKVPASAPLAERVMAEEVSKILNAHNWDKGR